MRAMADPTVSVIIPCYQASTWIAETLESVFAQDVGDMEVIVVDDGSTDGSPDVVRARFPSVLLVAGDHLGASRARNSGMRASCGTYLQFLDADDLLAAGKLTRQIEALERTGADVAYGAWWKLRPGPAGRFEKHELVSRALEGD